MHLRLAPTIAISAFALMASTASAGVLSPAMAVPAPWRDLGRSTPTTRVDVAVVLNYRNDAELDRLVENQVDETSPLYHQFLTPVQFARYFGPTPAAYADTIAQLRRAGFTITNTFPNRIIVDATAPVSVAERFFSTEIHFVRREDGSIRHINVRPETVPASLSRNVMGVIGLDNAHVMHPQYVRLPAGAPRPVAPARLSNSEPLFGPDGGYGPLVYRTSYGIPSALDGSGRASAVVGDADFLDTDLAGYLSYFGVTRTGPATVRVPVDGGAPKGISNDSVETTLDVETIVSIAPGTALYVYSVPPEPDLRYFADMYAQIVSDNKVDTVNTSYSECETALVPTFPKAADAIEKQGNALGITFHASSGDDGVNTYGCGNQVSVGTPTDTIHNVSIGGTIERVDHTTGQETTEVGWNDNSGATGGGVSTIFVLPKHQKSISTIIEGGRNLPDVAFDASPFTGESLYFEGDFDGPIGGTSLSSPIFGAGLTIIDQMNNSRAGFFTPKLYKTWKKNGYSNGSTVYLRDITSGSIPPYSAGPGYDQMTGIGAMIFGNLGKLLK